MSRTVAYQDRNAPSEASRRQASRRQAGSQGRRSVVEGPPLTGPVDPLRTKIVYLDLGMLLLRPPRRIAYHRQGRALWPTYPEDPANPGFAKRVGYEAHWTVCGLLIYQSKPDGELGLAVRGLDGIRLDNARLIARPCWKCWA